MFSARRWNGSRAASYQNFCNASRPQGAQRANGGVAEDDPALVDGATKFSQFLNKGYGGKYPRSGFLGDVSAQGHQSKATEQKRLSTQISTGK
jgi:hypothetical protein